MNWVIVIFSKTKFAFHCLNIGYSSPTNDNESETDEHDSETRFNTDKDQAEVTDSEADDEDSHKDDENDFVDERKLNEEINDVDDYTSLTDIFHVNLKHWKRFPSRDIGLAKRLFAVSFAVSTVILR